MEIPNQPLTRGQAYSVISLISEYLSDIYLMIELGYENPEECSRSLDDYWKESILITPENIEYDRVTIGFLSELKDRSLENLESIVEALAIANKTRK